MKMKQETMKQEWRYSFSVHCNNGRLWFNKAPGIAEEVLYDVHISHYTASILV